MVHKDLITLDDISSLDSLKKADLVVVDHNAPTGLISQKWTEKLNGCIDHHEDEHVVPEKVHPRIIKKSGSCTSLVVQHFRSAWDNLSSLSISSGAAHGQNDEYSGDDAALVRHWDAQVAKLGIGSILIDTYNMQSASKVTTDDKEAVTYLEAKILAAPGAATWDRNAFFQEIDSAKKNLDPLSVDDILRKDYKMWKEGGVNLGFSTVVKPIEWLISKAGSTRALLDAFEKFSKSRELGVFVLMAAFTSKDGEYKRELLVWARGDEALVKRATAFGNDAKSELDLVEWGGNGQDVNKEDAHTFRHVWGQQALQYSRKQVGPLIRKAIKG